MTLRLTVLCLLVVAIASPLAGADQYTVIVRLLPGDDLSLIAGQLAATHGVEIESIAAERREVVIRGSDARIRLLRTSPHVVRVDSAAVPLTIGPFDYDGSGNIKTIGTDNFVYDSASRIVSGTAGTNRIQEYSYDAFGNLQTITTDGNTSAPIRLHVDSSTNHASTPTPPSPSFNAYGSYDAAGNMIAFGDAGPFVYDALGMITDATIAGHRTVHLYTPSDERVASITLTKTGPSQWAEGPSEWTLRGPDQRILRRFLRSAAGTWSWDEDYIYRRGLLLAAEVNRPEKTLRFHLDHLGTPRLITGNGGAEVSRHTYYPFGLEATTTISSERLKFTGHERDQPNLDYMHARYYNGGWGRFLSVDPLDGLPEEPQSWNKYSYVQNQPVNYLDPTGAYRTDFHYNLTRILAVAAGYSVSDATAIARMTELPDHDRRNPESAFNYGARAAYHFPSQSRLRSMYVDAEATHGFNEIGTYLHALQDSYSHRGYGPGIGHIGPLLEGIGLDIVFGPQIGGTASGYLESFDVDTTASRPGLAMDAARATYDALVHLNGGQPAASFGAISNSIHGYLSADEHSVLRTFYENRLKKQLGIP